MYILPYMKYHLFPCVYKLCLFPCAYLFLYRFINYRITLHTCIILVQIVHLVDQSCFSLVTLNQYSTPHLICFNVNKTI